MLAAGTIQLWQRALCVWLRRDTGRKLVPSSHSILPCRSSSMLGRFVAASLAPQLDLSMPRISRKGASSEVENAAPITSQIHVDAYERAAPDRWRLTELDYGRRRRAFAPWMPESGGSGGGDSVGDAVSTACSARIASRNEDVNRSIKRTSASIGESKQRFLCFFVWTLVARHCCSFPRKQRPAAAAATLESTAV